jgi:hypothetical protein
MRGATHLVSSASEEASHCVVSVPCFFLDFHSSVTCNTIVYTWCPYLPFPPPQSGSQPLPDLTRGRPLCLCFCRKSAYTCTKKPATIKAQVTACIGDSATLVGGAVGCVVYGVSSSCEGGRR